MINISCAGFIDVLLCGYALDTETNQSTQYKSGNGNNNFIHDFPLVNIYFSGSKIWPTSHLTKKIS